MGKHWGGMTLAALCVAAMGCAARSAPELRPDARSDSARAEMRAPRAGSPNGAVGIVNFTARDAAASGGRVEQMLIGRVAGLDLQPDGQGSYRVHIRGTSSLIGDDEPLLVIDGMPTGRGRIGNALAALNPHDIERIEVLKDAMAAAYYGPRARHGAIVVTTRIR